MKILIVALVLVGQVLAQQVDWFHPSRLDAAVGSQTITVHGTNLASPNVQSAILLRSTSAGMVLHDSPAISSQTASSLDLLISIAPPAGEYVVVLFGCPNPMLCPNPVTLGVIDSFARPPQVSTILPATGPNSSVTPVTLSGTSLDSVTSVYLESGTSLIRCHLTGVPTATSLAFIVPSGATPGTYRVRAVCDDSASFYTSGQSPVVFTVTAPTTAAPRIAHSTASIAFNIQPTNVVLTGPGLGLLQSPQFFLDNPNDGQLPVPLVLTSALGADQVALIIPAGVPARLYDFLVTDVVHTVTAPSEAKILIVDTSVIDFYGNFSVIGVGPDTVAFWGGNWGAVVERGGLRYLVNFASGRPLVSDCGGVRGRLGIQFDTGPDHYVGSGLVLLGVTPNASVAGVDFRFATANGISFTSTWGLELPSSAALTHRISFDATTGASNVFGLRQAAIAVPTGFRHLTPAEGGLALDANFLAGQVEGWYGSSPSGSAFPSQGSQDVSVCFLEDPLGGGILVDATQLATEFDHVFHHWPAPVSTRTELSIDSWTRLAGLRVDQIGPVRYVPTTQDWVSAVEPYEAACSNPHIASKFPTMSHATVLLATGGAQHLTTADVLPPFNAVQDSRVFALTDWRIVHPHYPNDATPDFFPMWQPSSSFSTDVASLRAQHGFQVIPYLATPGLGPNFTPQLPHSQHIIQFLDRSAGVLRDQFWDWNMDGQFTVGSGDYWIVSLGLAAHRDEWYDQAKSATLSTFPFDGVFFDFLAGNLPLSDRNPLNANPQDGYRSLCDQFRASFQDWTIATEGQNSVLVAGGSSLGAVHVNTSELVAKDPMHGHYTMTNAHPIGAYLLRRNAKAFHAFDLCMPGRRAGSHIMSMMNGYMHDVMPTMSLLWQGNHEALVRHPEAQRAMVQTVEEGLFRRLHGLRMKTDPDPLWSAPGVAAVYELGGVTIPVTEDWIVSKLVCDLFWWFGGRAPTASELANYSGRTSCNVVSCYATMTEIRAYFRANPSVPVSRAAFRQAVASVFLYPIP